MSEHFSEAEFTRSNLAETHGIENVVPAYLRPSMIATMAGLERVRAALGFALTITSGYRCKALNELAGGQIKSQHLLAEAADFICPQFGEPIEICKFLADKMAVLGIDQMIQEGSWVHVSFTSHPRHEILTCKNGKYTPGLA